MIGIFFQLLWLGDMPLGATRITDSKMAAFVAAASLFTAAEIFNFTKVTVTAAILPALLFGYTSGIIGLHMTNIVRNINGKRSDCMISRLEQGDNKVINNKGITSRRDVACNVSKSALVSINRCHLAGVGSSFLRGVFMALVLVPAGTLTCGMISLLPGSSTDVACNVSSMVWGTVCASAVSVYWLKGNKKPLITGLIGGLIWVLMIIGRKG